MGNHHKGWDNRDTVKNPQRTAVAITFQNTTMMAHPMHLHGHHFQIVALNGKTFSGALRDTVHVPDGKGHPGVRCQQCRPVADALSQSLYHMKSGMITEVRYV
ncbi:multicopper oxidase domain-containing protein [Burkholderia multivorans]|uniref:multicopper oxidase domain-containing protein n=1 Tax=Burkholderia multivorans TaxID=87883 RepID=UPI0038BA9254